MSTIAVSISGGLYDAAVYVPAADVISTGLAPGITHQVRLGWVVWSSTVTHGFDVRPATDEERDAEIERLRLADLARRRRKNRRAARDISFAEFARTVPVYAAHMWAD